MANLLFPEFPSLRKVFQIRKTHIELVIIRPPLVYGHQAKGNFHRLAKLATAGWPIPFGKIDNIRSMIYVGNLANVIMCCAMHKKAAGKLYVVSDGMDVSTPELINMLAKASGRKAILLKIPVMILTLLGNLFRQRSVLDRVLGSLQVSNHSICNDLNWDPPYSLEEGINKSVGYYNTPKNY
jgi:nucleoside-diphosphate-sugar epimerase